MRWLTLYVRSRSVPTALAVAAISTAVLWALSQAIDHPGVRSTLAHLAVVAAVAAIGPGLGGADRDLERGAAIAWLPRRAAHVIVATAVVAGLLAATALTGDALAASAVVVRDVAGLGGLVAGGAATLGAARAWLPAVAWTLAVLPFAPPTSPTYQVVLTWVVQPAGTTAATVTAAVLAVTGTLAYATRGTAR